MWHGRPARARHVAGASRPRSDTIPSMTARAPITLAILAGGAGSRMGGPKSNLTLHGRPILDYLLDRFSWPGPTLLITSPGREHPPGHTRFSAEAVDPVPDQGPLRGILTALQHATTD